MELKVEEWDGGVGTWSMCSDCLSCIYSAVCYSEHLHETHDWPIELEVYNRSSCVNFDLTAWKWQEGTEHTMCIESPGNISVWFALGNDSWQWLGDTKAYETRIYSYRKSRHGWNFGYTSEVAEFHEVVETNRIPYDVGCYEVPSTLFGVYQSSPTGAVAVKVSIPSPVVQVTKKVGVLPQMFNLVSGIGGWIAVLTTMFKVIFVKMNPDAEVTKTYEARTFVGERVGVSRGKKDTE